MKIRKEEPEVDNTNTNGIALGACIYLILFILGVGIGSEYLAGSPPTDTRDMKGMMSEASQTKQLPLCDAESSAKKGNLVPASCETQPSANSDVPL